MKTKKESKTKTPDLEIVDEIFLVDKKDKKLLGLKPDIEEAPEVLVIPEGIEIIGPDVLFVSKNKFLRSNIKSVKFPDSLKKIENNAFFRCTDLADIQFGNGLEYIGKIAFASCRGLEKIVLPDSLRVIESQAFMDCSKLKNVVFNEGLQVIEWSAFYICKNLNEFVLPKSLRVVGDEALQYAKKVTIHGELPHNLMRAVSPMSWTTHSEYTSRKWPMVVELVADDGTYFLPKYIELANASDCECALNSGVQEKMQTLYKYCNSGDASADTAYLLFALSRTFLFYFLSSFFICISNSDIISCLQFPVNTFFIFFSTLFNQISVVCQKKSASLRSGFIISLFSFCVKYYFTFFYIFFTLSPISL